MRRAQHIALTEMRNEHKILVSKPEEKRSYGRPRCTSDDNNNICLKECENGDWIHM